MLRMVKISFFALALLIGLNILTMFLGVLTYTRLTDEMEIARVSFIEVGEKEYTATFNDLASGDINEYAVLGEQWQVDVRFLKLVPWANVLGFDAIYKLDRLSGRYKNIKDQNNNKKLSHALSEGDMLDPFEEIYEHTFLFFFLDAEYGNATYQDIDTNIVYSVYRTQSGVIARPYNEVVTNKSEESIMSSVKNWIME